MPNVRSKGQLFTTFKIVTKNELLKRLDEFPQPKRLKEYRFPQTLNAEIQRLIDELLTIVLQKGEKVILTLEVMYRSYA
jgi:hypothetical protein